MTRLAAQCVCGPEYKIPNTAMLSRIGAMCHMWVDGCQGRCCVGSRGCVGASALVDSCVDSFMHSNQRREGVFKFMY